MAGRAVTPALIDQMAATDAQWLVQVHDHIVNRLRQWNQACGSAAAMTALGYTTPADQAAITQLIADLQMLSQAFNGNQTAANTTSILPHMAGLMGVDLG